MSQDPLTFLQTLVTDIKARCADAVLQDAITYVNTTAPISKALAFGNGACLLLGRRLNLVGVHLGKLPPPIKAPRVAAAEAALERDRDNASPERPSPPRQDDVDVDVDAAAANPSAMYAPPNDSANPNDTNNNPNNNTNNCPVAVVADPASIAATQQDYFAPPDAGSAPAPTAATGSG